MSTSEIDTNSNFTFHSTSVIGGTINEQMEVKVYSHADFGCVALFGVITPEHVVKINETIVQGLKLNNHTIGLIDTAGLTQVPGLATINRGSDVFRNAGLSQLVVVSNQSKIIHFLLNMVTQLVSKDIPVKVCPNLDEALAYIDNYFKKHGGHA